MNDHGHNSRHGSAIRPGRRGAWRDGPGVRLDCARADRRSWARVAIAAREAAPQRPVFLFRESSPDATWPHSKSGRLHISKDDSLSEGGTWPAAPNAPSLGDFRVRAPERYFARGVPDWRLGRER